MKKIVIFTLAAALFSACGVQRHGAAEQPKKSKAAQTTRAAETDLMTGAYTDQRPLNDEEKKLFRTVTATLAGVKYTPESVVTQVVAGTNYRFVCRAEPVTQDPRTFRAEVFIFQPLPGRGEAHITEIRRL